MKTFIIQAIACCATLLPLSQARAATVFGDFVAGQTFTLHVGSVSQIGTRPSTIPKFSKGQAVKFTIGAKGQLTGRAASGTGPSFSIYYKSITKLSTYHENYYDNKTATTTTLVHQAIVRTKGTTWKPYFVNLALRAQSGFTVYQASYTFQ